jgi:hypothetical protein
MTTPKERNFICPATDDPCTDGRCTREIYCEKEKFRVERTKERIAQYDREYYAKIWGSISHFFGR